MTVLMITIKFIKFLYSEILKAHGLFYPLYHVTPQPPTCSIYTQLFAPLWYRVAPPPLLRWSMELLRCWLLWFGLSALSLVRSWWKALQVQRGSGLGSGSRFMEMEEEEEACSRRAAVRQLKQRLLEAVQANDGRQVEEILCRREIDVDAVLEVEDPAMVLASYKQGYWLPGYKLESSWASALHVSAMMDSVEVALVLLQAGAAVNRRPNGKTPLHVACSAASGQLVALLLAHGAKVNSLSLSGHTPLHYCVAAQSLDCAKQLILKGANVNQADQDNGEETPLHTAARHGVPELAALYLAHRASVDALNSLQETPLMCATFWTFDSREQTYSQNHHLVCRLLLDHGANPNLQEEDNKTALHKAAWNGDHVLMQMLLEGGADARAMDINGCAPIQYLLKVTDMRPAALPDRCYQLLLNHNAARIYPPQFHKVLQSCHDYPAVLEILVNSYERLKPTRKWRAAIPDDCYQRHADFYESLFSVCSASPRSLLHLSRCSIRSSLGGRCHSGVPGLPLPPRLKRYLLLEPEGALY
ncbi:ankyrin repeat and SOCS box protein 4 [Nelusetta ayraudi]|uniref:ankyrin repeat and SOCS box protein 4 n=1 Tax=Nelusetta ayraudi TaxID=303726 RepID=UPI003F7051D8